MESTDIIKDRQLVKLFNYLHDRQVLVKMKVPENKFEFLTVISAIHDMGTGYFFRIDDSENQSILKNGLSNTDTEIHFEFNGDDKLPYVFRTKGVKAVNNDLWVKFPEQVSRLQKRKNFRIDVPTGSILFLSKDDIEYNLSIINLSASGVYALYEMKKKSDKLLDLSMGESIDDVELLLTLPEQNDTGAFVKTAIVRRIEIKKEIKSIGYAFEFMKLNSRHQQNLIQFIYLVQRELLKKRAMMRR